MSMHVCMHVCVCVPMHNPIPINADFFSFNWSNGEKDIQNFHTRVRISLSLSFLISRRRDVSLSPAL